MFCPSCALGLVERAVEGVGAPGERALTSRVGTWTVWAREQLDILCA